MPWLITSLGGLLATIGASLAAKILVGIGFGAVTVVGVGLAISSILDLVQTNVSAAPAAAIQAMALVKIDVAINIIVSACLFKVALNSFNGAISKMNFKPPAP